MGDHKHQKHKHQHDKVAGKHEHEHEHGHEHEHEHGHEHENENENENENGNGNGNVARDAGAVPAEHKARAPRSARVFVITCSDSRTDATDTGGRWLRDALAARSHILSGSRIVRDEPTLITAALDEAKAAGAQAALVTGGTGISSRDSTFEAIERQLARPLPGFGELFRSLSYAEIGSAAMLSRAIAGVRQDGLLVFAMPGSPNAVRLAAEKLIFPELPHLLEELAR